MKTPIEVATAAWKKRCKGYSFCFNSGDVDWLSAVVEAERAEAQAAWTAMVERAERTALYWMNLHDKLAGKQTLGDVHAPADQEAVIASLAASSSVAWEALERIGYEHDEDGERFLGDSGEPHCGACLSLIGICDRREARDLSRQCPVGIARAALALRPGGKP